MPVIVAVGRPIVGDDRPVSEHLAAHDAPVYASSRLSSAFPFVPQNHKSQMRGLSTRV